MYKLGVIGMGNMGVAIINGIVAGELIPAREIMLLGRHPERMEPFVSAGAVLASSETELMESCQYVILAVKPQGFIALLPLLKPFCRPDHVIISVAAGISAQFLKDGLGQNVKLVLAMPNTPLQLGFGTTALARIAPTTEQEFAETLRFFQVSGDAVEIPPHLMNEVIPLNGSSPAFLYQIAKVFVAHAVECGFEHDVALKLFSGAMIGAAHMMLSSGTDLDTLIQAVCSKGGTTIAGLTAMHEHQLDDALIAGIEACTKRAYELGR